MPKYPWEFPLEEDETTPTENTDQSAGQNENEPQPAAGPAPSSPSQSADRSSSDAPTRPLAPIRDRDGAAEGSGQPPPQPPGGSPGGGAAPTRPGDRPGGLTGARAPARASEAGPHITRPAPPSKSPSGRRPTRLSSAPGPQTSQAGQGSRPGGPTTRRAQPDSTRLAPPRPWPEKTRRRINWGRALVRTVLTLVLLGIIASLLIAAGSIAVYAYIAGQLPPAEELKRRQFHFRTSTIYDRNGNVLWEINDPNFGRRTDVSLLEMAPDLRNATIATEDRNFYLNVGVDPIAIVRAVYYNVTEGSIVSGGSTITQQLVRNILLSQEERTERTLVRKVKEAVLAMEVAQQYTKNDILEIYLNQIYYGNLAYGIEAASRTYFGKKANQLTLAEAALMAGLPQSPAIYDPYTNPEGAKARQEVALGLMVEAGYVTAAEATAAAAEPVIENLQEPSFEFAAPHFVTLVRAELEATYPPEVIYQAGLRIETTLDQRLQTLAEEIVAAQVNSLAARHVTNGALVAVEVETGEVLAMVGSKDFRDEAIAGQVNMALAPRQPGSAIKPLVYLAAFERGWTPATLIMDVPVEYPDGQGGVYRPQNYDQKFHGPTTARFALANSYNIPAVKTLEFVGLEGLKEMAARLGITTFTRADYGLALALGGGEAPLLEMTGAYQAIANGGVWVKPHTILRVQDNLGRDITPPRPEPRPVLRAEHAYLMTHILADNQARSRIFGPDSVLNLSRPAAAKTGTTNDYRDNLVFGYTPDIVTGVWVGNADYSPMQGTTGLSGAGPIWHDFMERAHEGLPVRDFARPAGIVQLEVCADSGAMPSQVCPERRAEIFAADQPPLGPEHDIHQMIDIDLNTNKRANEYCRTNVETRYYQVYPPDGRDWAISQGIAQPPLEYCPSLAIDARIVSPADGETVQGVISIEGYALAANFSYYELEYGVGTGPQAFGKLTPPQTRLVEGGVLEVFDTTEFPNGPYTLRLVVYDQSGGGLESRVRILIDNPPTPTPTETPAPALTPMPTETPEPPAATATLTPTPVEPTPAPINTETPTPTLEPTTAPTKTPTPEAPTETPTETVPEATPTDVLPEDTPTPEGTPAETPTA